MELLSVGVARSIWLFDINELNPTGKSIFPEVFTWLGERYSFQKFPKSIADLDPEKKAYVFMAGAFQTGHDTITVNFSLYNDGVVADTWASTENGDAFLDEILRSAVSKYSLSFRPDMIRAKQYVSEVTVRLDLPLSKLNPKVTGFSETISNVFKRHGLAPFELSGMTFAPDISASSYKPPGFSIERKIGAPFTENRFWSKSPFTTKDHMFALKEFEKLLLG